MSAWLGLLVWALAAHALHLRGRRQLVLALRARHEVRGPLCTAQLALDGLERSARVEAIGLELRRAARALDDLAGLRGGGEIEPLDLGGLLADAAHGWHALADAHGVRLAIEPAPAKVVGDPLRLAQACANLVANAVEHGGGGVRVSSSAAGGRVRVEVADLGPGLPAPVGALIAAAGGRRSARGHGLAIAAAIAKRHGGHLTSLPAPKGARLLLDLPEAGSAAPRSSPLRLRAPRFSPLRRRAPRFSPRLRTRRRAPRFSRRRATPPPGRPP